MSKTLLRLKGYTGRVLRDIERQMDKVMEGPLEARITEVWGSVESKAAAPV